MRLRGSSEKGRVAAVNFPGDVPVLTDGTITLRAHNEGDVQGLYEQANDPDMLRWTTVPDPSTLETARTFATDLIPNAWRHDTGWSFAVDAPGDDGRPRFLGTVSLRNEGNQRAEIAYGAHPWGRGRGHIVAALNLLLDWGFEEKNLKTVIWWANKGNWASRKVAWRLGFSFDGTIRGWMPQRGELRDAWVGVLQSSDVRKPGNPWLDVPRITGTNVVLRQHRPEDADRVFEACSDERTAYWLAQMPSPYTLDTAREFLEGRTESLASGTGVHWAVADPGTDELLANISLFDILAAREAEIGYWTHPAARGLGVMTEACRLVIRHAFIPEEDGGQGLSRLMTYAAESNTASRHVIEENGFIETGRERAATRLRDGSLVDTITYDLLESEYRGHEAT